MSKVKVRLKLREEPFEVDEDEIPNLQGQGLLVEVLPGAKTSAAAKAASTEKQGA